MQCYTILNYIKLYCTKWILSNAHLAMNGNNWVNVASLRFERWCPTIANALKIVGSSESLVLEWTNASSNFAPLTNATIAFAEVAKQRFVLHAVFCATLFGLQMTTLSSACNWVNYWNTHMYQLSDTCLVSACQQSVLLILYNV